MAKAWWATNPANGIEYPSNQVYSSRDMPMNGAVRSQTTFNPYRSTPSGLGGGPRGVSQTVSTPELGQPYRGIGKTNVGIGGAFTRPEQVFTPPAEGFTAPAQGLVPGAPTPQAHEVGIIEGMVSGLSRILFGFLPQDHLNNLSSGLGNVASIIDLPFEALDDFQPPWVKSITEGFELLPQTETWQSIKDLADTNPTEALKYMGEYLRTHEEDYMTALGVNPIFSPFVMPDRNPLERILNIPGLAGQTIARHVAGMDIRDVDGAILNAPDEALTPELREIKRRFHEGTMTRDQVLDAITNAGAAFNNDPALGLFFALITDPLVFANMGVGFAAKAVRAGSIANRVAGTLSRIEKALPAEYTAVRDAYHLREAAALQGRSNLDQATALERVANPPTREGLVRYNDQLLDSMRSNPRINVDQFGEEALQGMSRFERSQIAIEPFLRSAAKVSNLINLNFGVFGRDRVGASMQALRSDRHSRAIASVYGEGNLAAIHAAVNQYGGDADLFLSSYGTWSAQSEMQLVHGRSLVRRLLGHGEQPGITEASPTQRIKEIAYVSHDRMTIESEAELRKVKPDFVPDTTGVASTDVASARSRIYEQQKDTAVKQLVYATGMSEDGARRIVGRNVGKQADQDVLALAEGLAWGRSVANFLKRRNETQPRVGQAMTNLQNSIAAIATAKDRATVKRRKAMEKELKALEAQAAQLPRYTLVGERELTYDIAEELLEKADGGAVTAISELRAAVRQYDILRNNFEAVVDDDVFKANISTFLRGLLNEDLAGGTALVRVLKRESLPDEMVQFMDETIAGGREYRIGLAPKAEAQWRITKDLEGRLVGAAPWIDLVGDAAPTYIPTALDRVRHGLFKPIRGERLLYDAKRAFAVQAEATYRLSKLDSDKVFWAIRRASSEAKTQPRGLMMDQFKDIIEKVSLPDDIKQKLGADGLALLTARAFSGDVMTVGLTSKLTGSKLGKSNRMWGTWVAVVSEKIYPQVRFHLNPIFQLQEWIEPYFFNIIRGVKPGMRWTQEDREMLAMLDRWGLGSRFTDMAEYSYLEHQGILATTKPGTFEKNGRVSAANEKLMKIREVKERKQLNYIRQVRMDGGENFRRAVMSSSPRFWQELTTHYGTADPSKIAQKFWIDKGIFHPDDPDYMRFQAGAVSPQNVGKPERVRVPMLARHFDYATEADFRKAIADGTMTEARFRADSTMASWDKDYVDRSWRVASFVSPEAYYAGVRDAFRQAGNSLADAAMATNVMRVLDTARATAKDLGLHEYLALHRKEPATFLDSSGKLPTGSMTQSARELVAALGHWRVDADGNSRSIEYTPAGSERFERVRGRMHQLIDFNDPKKVRKVQNGKKAGEGPAGAPTTDIHVEWKDSNGNLVLQAGGNRTPQQFLDELDRAIPVDEELFTAGAWYEEMTSFYIALADAMPEEDIARLNRMMDNVGDLERQADPRDELAARLVLAFSATQANASPLDGISQVAGILDEVLRGSRSGESVKNLGKSIQIGKLEAMLKEFGKMDSFGIGSKLADFTDSLAGKVTRSVNPGDINEPAAMDIWMLRTFGYYDEAYIQNITTTLIARGVKKGTPAQVFEEVMKELGITKADLHSLPKSQGQYERALTRFNEVLQHARATSYRGKSDWSARELQAALWVGTQRAVNAPANDIGSLLRHQSMDVAFEMVRSTHSTFADSIGSYDDLVARHGLAGVAMASAEVTRKVIPIIEQLTGVYIVDRPIDGFGRWRVGEGLAIAPNTQWTIFGHDRNIKDAVDTLAYILQQDEVFATRPGKPRSKPSLYPKAGGRVRPSAGQTEAHVEGRGFYWSHDWVPLMPKGSQPTAAVKDALADYMHIVMPQMDGHMVARDPEGRELIRSVWFHDQARPGYKARGSADQATFEKHQPFEVDEDARALGIVNPEQELRDGTWVQRLADYTLPDGTRPHADVAAGDAVPVEPIRNIVEVYQSQNKPRRGTPERAAYPGGGEGGSTWEHQRGRAQARSHGLDDAAREAAHGEELGGPILQRLRDRGRGDLADQLVGERGREAHRLVEDAWSSLDSDAGQRSRGASQLLEQGGDYSDGGRVRHQVGPAGVRGATKQHALEQSTVYLLKTADAGTAVHEMLHVFVNEMDVSAKDVIATAYSNVKGRKSHVTAWTKDVEEWAAEQFMEYVAGGAKVAPIPAMAPIFNAFGDWSRTTLKRKAATVRPEVTDIFDKLFDATKGAPKAHFDVDQARWIGAMRDAYARAEEEAHKVHYYSRGRSWTERSINHPYLGMYPASYMWGKVMPQMLRFLIKKPFGIDAPLAGLQMAKHVQFYTQLWMQSEEDIGDFIEANPNVIRFFQLLLPGTPWDIPVNAPAWARHLTEDQLQNQARVAAGLEPQDTDFGSIIGDTINYSFGMGRNVEQPMDILSEMGDIVSGGWRDDKDDPDVQDASNASAIWSQLAARGQTGY